MRRTRQLLSDEETAGMMERATSGVLALQDADGYPYAVPLSFVYHDGKIYFHSATAGHKLEAVAHSDKASFCVIADDEVVQSAFTTHFRSAIAFGRVKVLADDAEKRNALRLLARKYSPEYVDAAESEIEWDWNRVCALELAVERMTGKAAIEIIGERDRPSADGE